MKIRYNYKIIDILLRKMSKNDEKNIPVCGMFCRLSKNSWRRKRKNIEKLTLYFPCLVPFIMLKLIKL